MLRRSTARNARCTTGIAHSCDAYFYNVGEKIGIDNIAFYAHMVGLRREDGRRSSKRGERHRCPRRNGNCATSAQKWYAGETISVSIGQGALTVTPLQLARAIGGLAIGGVWHTPHLLE